MYAGGIVIVVRMDCCRLVVLEYMIGFPTCFSYPFSVSLASCRFAVAPSLWDLKYGDAASTLQHCEDFICILSLSFSLFMVSCSFQVLRCAGGWSCVGVDQVLVG